MSEHSIRCALGRLVAVSEGDVDREHPWPPVGEPGGHIAVGTYERGEAGEVLISSRPGLPGQRDPQSQAPCLTAGVTQAAALPPGESSPPGRFIRAPPMQSRSRREQDQCSTSRRSGIERRIDPASAQMATPNRAPAWSKITDLAAVV